MIKKVAKGALALSLLGIGFTSAFTVSQPNSAQAKSHTHVLKYYNVRATKVHVSSGTIYSSATLSKKAHNARNYKYTTFTTTKKATIKKSNGKTASYQYISNGKVKGWIWSSYIKNGVAPRSFTSYKLAIQDAIASPTVDITSVDDARNFSDIYDSLSDEVNPDTQKTYDADVVAFEKIHDIFKNRFTSAQNSHITSMINQAKNVSVDNDNSSSALGSVGEALGEAISHLK